MSTDAKYILCYEDFYEDLMHADMQFLKNKYGGDDRNFIVLYGSNSFFWDKPKNKLTKDDLILLCAYQIFEKRDYEPWVTIKSLYIINDNGKLTDVYLQFQRSLKRIEELDNELRIWKKAYKKNIRPKSAMIEQQNAIGAQDAAETLRRLVSEEPVSDRYLMGLAWMLFDMNGNSKDEN